MSDFKDDSLETDLDDEFSFDDDLDFGVDDFPFGDPPADDRTPKEKVKDIARKSIVQAVASPDAAKDVLSKALPKSYTSAANKAMEAKDFAVDARDAIFEEIGPLTENVKKIAAASHKKVSWILPKTINDKITALTAARESSDYGGSYKEADAEERRSQQAASMVADLLKGQAELDEARRAADRDEEYAKDAMDSIRHKDAMDVTYRTAVGVDKLVSFNEQFATKIHSKSLEIQLKQYMLLSDFANKSLESSTKSLEVLAHIQKNTALPEVQKIQLDETLRGQTRQRLADAAINRVSDFTANWTKQLRDNIKSTIGQYTGQVEMMASMSDMMEGMDMGFGDPDAMAANSYGSMMRGFLLGKADWAHNKLLGIKAYKEAVDKVQGNESIKKFTQGIKRGDGFLQSATADLSGDMQRLGDSMRQSDSSLVRFIGGLLPDMASGKDAIKRDQLDTLNQAAIFDNKVYRSITEAIPGHLSSIDRWLQMIATNEYVAPKDALVYDFARGGFTTAGTRERTIKALLSNVMGNGAMRDGLQQFAKDTLGFDLSKDNPESDAVREMLLSYADEGVSFDPRTLSDRIKLNKKIPESTKAELQKLLSDKYKLDDKSIWGDADAEAFIDYGEWNELLWSDKPVKDQLKAKAERAKILARVRRGQAERAFGQLENMGDERKQFANLKTKLNLAPTAINILMEAFGADALRDAGLVTTSLTGTSRIDHDNFLSLAANATAPKRTDDVVPNVNYDQLPPIGAPVGKGDAAYLKSLIPVIKELKGTLGDSLEMQVYELISHAEDNITWQEYHAELLEDIRNALKEEGAAAAIIDSVSQMSDDIRQAPPVTLQLLADQLIKDVESNNRILMRVDQIQERLQPPSMDLEWRDRQLELLDQIKASNERQEQLAAACCETTNANLMGLLEISGASINIDAGNWSPGRLFNSVYQMGKKAGSPAVKAISGYINFWTKTYGKIGKGIGQIAGWGLKQISNVTGKLGKAFTDTEDVYVKGDTRPRLRAIDIEAGRYMDLITKRTITTLDDIQGPVWDTLKEQEVLSEEDFKLGLTNNKGHSILSKATQLMGKGVRGYFGIYKGLFDAGGNVASKLLDGAVFIKDQIVASADGFLPGEDTPRVFGRLLDRGDYYYCSVSKRFVKSYEEIQGDLLDPDGRVVLTLKELEQHKGLVNRFGVKISLNRTTFDKAVGLVTGGIKAYGNYVKGLYTMGKTIAVGAWNKVKNFFNHGITITGDHSVDLLAVNHAQLSVQEKIYNLLYEVHKDKLENSLWDKDGDGFRDGDWRSVKSAEEATEEKEDDKEDPDERVKKGDDAWSDLKDKAGDAMDWVGDRVDDALDVYDRIKGRRRRRPGARRRRRRMRRRGGGRNPGMIRKTGQALLRAGQWAAQGAMRIPAVAAAIPAIGGAAASAGATVLGWGGAALAGAKGLALGAMGLVSAPVVLGAAAIGATAYGGFKLWKHLSRDRAPLSELRITQYGAKPTNKDAASAVLNMEELCSRAVQYSAEKGVSLELNKLNLIEITNAMGLKLSNPTDQERTAKELEPLLGWFTARFQPVFLAWEAARRKHCPDVKLSQLDDKIKSSVALNLLDDVELNNHEGYKFLGKPSKHVKIDRDLSDVLIAFKYAKSHYKKKLKDNPEPEPKEDDKKSDIPTDAQGKGVTKGEDGEWREMTGSEVVAAAAKMDQVRQTNKDGDSTLSGTAKVPTTSSKIGKFIKTAARVVLPGAALVTYGLNKAHAAKLKSKQTKENLDNIKALSAIRFTAYGLRSMDRWRIYAIKQLEDWCFDKLSYNGPEAYLTANSQDALTQVGHWFSSTKDNPGFETDWTGWFVDRFTPVMLSFATAVRQHGRFSPWMADEGLKGQAALNIAEGILEAQTYDGHSIWTVPASPWKDYTLSKEAADANDYLEVLRIEMEGSDTKVDGEGLAVAKRLAQEAEEKAEAEKSLGSRFKDLMTKPWRALAEWWNKPGAEQDSDNPGMFTRIKQGVTGWFGGGGSAATAEHTPTSGGTSSAGTGYYPQSTGVGAYGQPANSGYSNPTNHNYPDGKKAGIGLNDIVYVRDAPKGTGGDYRTLPDSKGVGLNANRDLLMEAARRVGVDPTVGFSVIGSESGYDPGVLTGLHKDGSAQGFFQIINRTWEGLKTNYADQYGVPKNAVVTDPKAHAILGMAGIKENFDRFKRDMKRNPTHLELYMMQFLGPHLGIQFAKAPNHLIAKSIVPPKEYGYNVPVFHHGGKATGQLKTVGEVKQHYLHRLNEARMAHAGFTEAPNVFDAGYGAPAEPEGTYRGDFVGPLPEGAEVTPDPVMVPSPDHQAAMQGTATGGYSNIPYDAAQTQSYAQPRPTPVVRSYGTGATPPMQYSGGGGGGYGAMPEGGGGGSFNAIPVRHPGGGTGGDVRTLPPSKGDGLAANKDLILAAAAMTGTDPSLAFSMAQLESNYRPRVGAGTSSAKGMYQFIDETWQSMLKQYGHKYGIARNAHPFDARANALMGLEYLKENIRKFQRWFPNRSVSQLDMYLSHFLGAGKDDGSNGAHRFLRAPDGDPVDRHVSPAAFRANKGVFRQYISKNNYGRTLTVGEVKAGLQKRIDNARAGHKSFTEVGFNPAQELAKLTDVQTTESAQGVEANAPTNVADTGTVEQAAYIQQQNQPTPAPTGQEIPADPSQRESMVGKVMPMDPDLDTSQNPEFRSERGLGGTDPLSPTGGTSTVSAPSAQSAEAMDRLIAEAKRTDADGNVIIGNDPAVLAQQGLLGDITDEAAEKARYDALYGPLSPTEQHIVTMNTPFGVRPEPIFKRPVMERVADKLRNAMPWNRTTDTDVTYETPDFSVPLPMPSVLAQRADTAAPAAVQVDMHTTNAILNNQLKVLSSIDEKMSTVIGKLDARPAAPSPHAYSDTVQQPAAPTPMATKMTGMQHRMLESTEPNVVSSTARNKRHTTLGGGGGEQNRRLA